MPYVIRFTNSLSSPSAPTENQWVREVVNKPGASTDGFLHTAYKKQEALVVSSPREAFHTVNRWCKNHDDTHLRRYRYWTEPVMSAADLVGTA